MDKKLRIFLAAVALLVAPILPSCLSDGDDTIIVAGKLESAIENNNQNNKPQDDNQNNNEDENQNNNNQDENQNNEQNNQDENQNLNQNDEPFVPGKGEGIFRVVPKETVEKIQDYMPINDGNTPPNVEGVFVLNPLTLIFSEDGTMQPGFLFSPLVLRLTNQNGAECTIDYDGWQMNSSEHGKGAYISGSGNDFTLYFNLEGESRSKQGAGIIKTTSAVVISGTVTSSGLSNVIYTYTLVSKENDPYNELMATGYYRVTHDDDGLSEYYSAFSDDKYVDLGLPSGRLWAKCNVGASNPWEYGSYFSWGEIATKTVPYNMDNYKYFTDLKPNKYCMSSADGYNGFSDNIDVLDLQDDAAINNLGIFWRMPSIDDWQELMDNCTLEWTSSYEGSGISGVIVRSKVYSGRHLFFPLAGMYYGDELQETSVFGYYWSTKLNIDPLQAFAMGFDSQNLAQWYVVTRSIGLPVRPVW